jgi:hypothetical protein
MIWQCAQSEGPRTRLTILLILLFAFPATTAETMEESPMPVVISQKDDRGVLEVWKKGARNDREVAEAGIGDTIGLIVANLDGWLIDLVNQRRIEGVGLSSPDALREFAKLNADGGAAWRKEKERVETVIKSHEEEASTFDADLKKLQLEKKDAEAERQQHAATSSEIPQLEERLRVIIQSLAPLEAKLANYNSALARQKELDQDRGVFRALLEQVKGNLYLILNDNQLRELKPLNAADPRKSDDPVTGNTYHLLYYQLEKKPEDARMWNKLYSGLHHAMLSSVQLGAVIEDKQFTIPTRVKPDSKDPRLRFRLEVYSLWRLVGAGALILVALVVFLRMIGPTDILRDPDTCLRPDGRLQFSLARSQMAFWFFLVVAAFVVLWVVTGELDTLNNTALWLIGIGTGTALGSAMISAAGTSEATKQEDRETLLNKDRGIQQVSDAIEAKEIEITAARADLRNAVGDQVRQDATQALDRRLNERQFLQAEKAYKELGRKKLGAWRQLLFDLLNENGRITFHRFQMLVWTGVLGFVFAVKVAQELAMPEFSATVLALVGISAGTYVGFKIPEAIR